MPQTDPVAGMVMDRNLALEQIGEQRLDPLRPGVVAISRGEPVIGSQHRLQDRGARPGEIVADEVHGTVSRKQLRSFCRGSSRTALPLARCTAMPPSQFTTKPQEQLPGWPKPANDVKMSQLSRN